MLNPLPRGDREGKSEAARAGSVMGANEVGWILAIVVVQPHMIVWGRQIKIT